MREKYLEVLKEFLRIIVLAIIPVIILGINLNTGIISVNWRLALAVGLVAGLKAIDKGMHEWGKKTGNISMTKGIVRF